MTSSSQPKDRTALIAILGAVFLVAHMISGKAARDSLFLLNFPVEYLPRMTVVAASTSIVLVVLWARKLAARSPAELVPVALLASCATHFVLWALYLVQSQVSAVLFYMYMIGPNAILLSSYWSLLNERFDPREAKRVFARVTAGGTIGGLLSGGLADRVADYFGAPSLLPMLAILQLTAYFLVRSLAAPMAKQRTHASNRQTDFAAGFRYIRSNRYLSTLAALVLVVTMSAGLIDYVFKSGVAGVLGRSEDLVTFFAMFYALSSLGTFLLQSFVAPVFFQRFGLTQSLMALPFACLAGIAGRVLVPGLPGYAMLRGFEAVIRGSIYRSGYEVCYTPVTNREKRASKTIIDVGADRLGEATGGALLQGMLMVGIVGVSEGALILAALLSVAAAVLTYRMGRMYVSTLETSLISRAREMESDIESLPNFNAESVMMGSLQEITLSGQLEDAMRRKRLDATMTRTAPLPLASSGDGDTGTAHGHTDSARITHIGSTDPVLDRLSALRSGDVRRVLAALTSKQPMDPLHVAAAIRLLAWDDVSETVVRVLRQVPFPIEGQLADALLNRGADFSVRRRVPRVLAARPGQITVEALFQGLRDQRFEVRFRCGNALAKVARMDGGLIIDSGRVFRAVERECFVSKTVWNSYRLLEHIDDKEEDSYFDEVLKDRTGKGLEHVFTLLSLVLPREPLQIAFKGLHTSDPHLRGTALEYLETVLPETIRERLWPLLESNARNHRLEHDSRRSREEILADLRRSNQSIIINLEKRQSESSPDSEVRET
jgi:AAA family ATP:ADP antiporter